MVRTSLFTILLFTLFSCKKHKDSTNDSAVVFSSTNRDSIIDTHVYQCADTYNYNFNMPEYQACLDDGLEKDPTIGYLWQQKSMPYFKLRKYEAGMEFLDKAVEYEPEKYLSYRAFIKCVFAKTYQEAIIDFEKCIEMEGNRVVMDHSYQFHIALSYLQLNEFSKAETIFKEDIEEQISQWGSAHFIDLFYYAISQYEQGKYEQAIQTFNQCLNQYPTFSDAFYYKSVCHYRMGEKDKGSKDYDNFKKNRDLGNTFNESNSIYEPYPYQLSFTRS